MSNSRDARAAVVYGVLAVAAIPLGALAARLLPDVRLLTGELVAVPLALLLGAAALRSARRARAKLERSIRRPNERLVRTAGLVAWTGLYLGVTGLLALGVYGVLRLYS
jgi:hypothetical protein